MSSVYIRRSSLDPFCRFALGGDAFKVHIYVGKDKEVGTVYNFSARPEETGGPEGCGNCRSQQEDETLATGQVHVTVPLLDAVQNSSIALSSLHPDHVEEYLKKHLHWKVTKVSVVSDCVLSQE